MRRKFSLGIKKQLLYYEEEFDELFKKAEKFWTTNAHRNLIERMKIATGNLLENTYAVYTRSKRGGYHLKLHVDAAYWEKVERGRSAGDTPSISELVTWIRGKRRAFKKYGQNLSDVNKGLFYIKKKVGYSYHRMTDKEAAKRLKERIQKHGTHSSRHRFEGLLHSASENTPYYTIFPNLMFKKIGVENHSWLTKKIDEVERVSLTKTKKQVLEDKELESLINYIEEELIKIFVKLSSRLQDLEQGKEESALEFRKRLKESKDEIRFALQKKDLKEYRKQAKKLIKSVISDALGFKNLPKSRKINTTLNKINNKFLSLQSKSDAMLVGKSKIDSIRLDSDYYKFEKTLNKMKPVMEMDKLYKLVNKLLRDAKGI